MSQDAFELSRQKHLRRALSVLIRTADFDSVSSSSLDILCNVAVLYMQTMFAQVHAYAEHATRTRPNMNDVGRALDERRISVAQLDAYLSSEYAHRLDPAIAAAVASLHQQQPQPQPQTASSLEGSSVFFENRTEGLLRQLVGSHIDLIKERSRKEQLEKQAAIEAAAAATAAAAAAALSASNPRAGTKVGGRGKDHGKHAGRSRAAHSNLSIGIGMDSLTSDEDDLEDADVDIDNEDPALKGKPKSPHIRFNDVVEDDRHGGDDYDDEDEDADFEAPDISMHHLQTQASVADSDADAIQPNSLEQQSQQGLDPAADVPATTELETTAQPANPTPNDGSPIPTAGAAAVAAPQTDGELDPGLALVNEIETLLLPTSVLPDYVPEQCPAFPSPHTYKHTPVYPKREQDFFRNRMHKAEQSRQAEENLQRLISGPLAAESAAAVDSASPSQPSMPSASSSTIPVAENHKESPTTSNENASLEGQKQQKQQALKRIHQLFPPPNFRSIDKRARISSSLIK